MPDFITKISMKKMGRIYAATVLPLEHHTDEFSPYDINGFQYFPEPEIIRFWFACNDAEEGCRLARKMYKKYQLHNISPDTKIIQIEVGLVL
jgi:hypothetical protein